MTMNFYPVDFSKMLRTLFLALCLTGLLVMADSCGGSNDEWSDVTEIRDDQYNRMK